MNPYEARKLARRLHEDSARRIETILVRLAAEGTLSEDKYRAERALADDLASVVAGGLVAVDLTRQYVGEKMLPAVEGWSWFDWTQRAEAALARHKAAF